MDSVTQIVLGASLAGVCAPAGQRRKALLIGAALGTLPDLDVFIDYGGAVENYTFHRGFSHSLFVLLPFATLLWAVLRRWWAPVRAAPGRWYAAIALALLTHPLLDAHTAYGTQLWWPLTTPPVSWSTLFIIDPLYTLPLLITVLVALLRPAARWTGPMLMAGLLLSTAYLGWSWVGKSMVERNARAVLSEQGLGTAPLFSVPTPFNTLLWRVVVLTDEGYLEGLDSLVADDGPIRFTRHPSDRRALEAAMNVWAVRRLRWFARDFVSATVEDDVLVVSDLRMGQEPVYVFRHAVAKRGNPHWMAIETRLLPAAWDRRLLEDVWQRIWSSR
jgi:inner membrane protein